MIIVANKSGQLCNQLILFAHAIATAAESGQKIKHLFGYDFDQYFDFDHEFGKLILHKDIWKIFWRIEYIRYKESKYFKPIRAILLGRDLKVPTMEESKQIAQKYREKGIHIILYWQYRDYDALFRQRGKLCEIFKPRQQICQEVSAIVTSLKKNDDELLIAVHLRRGDYKDWCNGRFYYNDTTYRRWMQAIANSCGKKCTFVLFSNEKLEQDVFTGHGYRVILAKGDAIHDLYTMASCDYIMGPPSTFSWWAAFYGNKLYYTLYKEDLIVNLKLFRRVKGEEFNPLRYLES